METSVALWELRKTFARKKLPVLRFSVIRLRMAEEHGMVLGFDELQEDAYFR
ncbi:hypothetical protein [Paraburkholderia sprentiae]|uniref:hypothetical protein n=1 Tax=Paraburkholderia sprentiae TaxID=948107 RepID=UPI0004196080|nr:hypothetical protein [Paraburkholderia sprentiae]